MLGLYSATIFRMICKVNLTVASNIINYVILLNENDLSVSIAHVVTFNDGSFDVYVKP